MRYLVVLFLGLLALGASAQESDIRQALIVVDIQDFYFPEGNVPLNNPEEAAENAFKLIDSFRANDLPVVFIKHKYEPGGDINDIVLPLSDDMVFEKSEVSSFNGTGLDKYLKSIDVNHIVICGMQTHMCVEAATRAGYDLGYGCTLVEDACTTRDLKYGDHTIKAAEVHYSTLATLKSYAEVVTTKEFLSNNL